MAKRAVLRSFGRHWLKPLTFWLLAFSKERVQRSDPKPESLFVIKLPAPFP